MRAYCSMSHVCTALPCVVAGMCSKKRHDVFTVYVCLYSVCLQDDHHSVMIHDAIKDDHLKQYEDDK